MYIYLKSTEKIFHKFPEDKTTPNQPAYKTDRNGNDLPCSTETKCVTRQSSITFKGLRSNIFNPG